jgi:copper chaperone CopZ
VKKLSIGLAALAVSCALAWPLLAETKSATFEVSGWSCGSCASTTRIALKKLDGVQDVKTDPDKKEADPRLLLLRFHEGRPREIRRGTRRNNPSVDRRGSPGGALRVRGEQPRRHLLPRQCLEGDPGDRAYEAGGVRLKRNDLFSGGRSLELDLPDVCLGVIPDEKEGLVVPRETELRPKDADPASASLPGPEAQLVEHQQ